MRRLFAALFALICVTAFADSPPSYAAFESKSANSKFFAKVDVIDRMGKPAPWEWKYQIQVFDVAATSKPLWISEYKYDGYSGGVLSNDGRYFVYVSFWFFDDGPIVYIYTKGGTKMYTAKDLRITAKGLNESASHKLWLKGRGTYWPASGAPIKFIINTEQGERSIDL